MTANTTGKRNTSVGADAMASNTTGDENTALGQRAGYQITTGDYNSCHGWNAGGSITTGRPQPNLDLSLSSRPFISLGYLSQVRII